jgi:hypothetical protein
MYIYIHIHVSSLSIVFSKEGKPQHDKSNGPLGMAESAIVSARHVRGLLWSLILGCHLANANDGPPAKG